MRLVQVLLQLLSPSLSAKSEKSDKRYSSVNSCVCEGGREREAKTQITWHSPLLRFLPSLFLVSPSSHVPPGCGAHHAVAEEGRVRLRPQEADDHHRTVFSGEEEEEERYIYFPGI